MYFPFGYFVGMAIDLCLLMGIFLTIINGRSGFNAMMDVCGYQFLLNAFAKFIEVMIIRY
jgi:hypothetical protein